MILSDEKTQFALETEGTKVELLEVMRETISSAESLNTKPTPECENLWLWQMMM